MSFVDRLVGATHTHSDVHSLLAKEMNVLY